MKPIAAATSGLFFILYTSGAFGASSVESGSAPSLEPIPLTITNTDHEILLKLEPNGTLLVDWDKIKDACQPRVAWGGWDATSALLCILWAEHKGDVRPLRPSPP